MSAKLFAQCYGKSRVRVLKVLRDGETHLVKELNVAVSLEGDFESSYTSGDNSKVVATDTMKNTVNVFAKKHLGEENEPFTLMLARHFLEKYPQVRKTAVRAVERVWERMSIGGSPHPHSFLQTQNAQPFTRAVVSEDVTSMESGIGNLLILKSSGSGFENYPRCEFTTLPETRDRLFATALTATWTWSGEPGNYAESNRAIVTAMMKTFAENYSPSVQATLFEMGEAALAACAEISKIHIEMPNKHCLLIDLNPLGLENKNELFVPIDEPHGQIEATIGR